MQRHISVTPSWPEQGIEFVLPASGWQGFTAAPLPVADETVIAFCAALSQRLLSLGREWPDLAALGSGCGRWLSMSTCKVMYRVRLWD